MPGLFRRPPQPQRRLPKAEIASPYKSLVLSRSGLKGYYRVGENGGGIAYDELRLNNLTYTGTPGYGSASLLTNDPNTSTDFTSAYATGSTIPSAVGTVLTLVAWFKLSSDVGNVGLVSNWDPGSSGGFLIQMTAGSILAGINGGGPVTYGPAANIYDNVRHEVIYVFNGTDDRIYLDGALVAGPRSIPGSLSASTNPLQIGAYGAAGGGSRPGGLVDEVSWYLAEFSPAMVLEDWRVGSATVAQNLSRTSTDALTLADVATRTVQSFRTTSDSSGRSDVATRAVVLNRTSADALTLADAATASRSFVRTVADALGLGGGTATPALTQFKSGTNSLSAQSLTLDSTPTAGRILIAALWRRRFGTVTPGTGWNLITDGVNTNPTASQESALLWKLVPGGDTAAQAVGTWSGTPAESRVTIAEFSGLAASPLDQTGLAKINLQATATSQQLSITPTAGQSVLLIGLWHDVNSRTFTSSDSIIDQGLSDAGFAPTGMMLYRLVNPTSGSYTLTGTANTTDEWAGAAASFLASSTGDVATRVVILFRTASDSISRSDVATRALSLFRTNGAFVDNFNRSVSNDWGTATNGGSWARLSGNAADYQVNGSEATTAATTLATEYVQGLTSISQSNFDVTIKFKTDKVDLGDEQQVLLTVRRGGTNDYKFVFILTTSDVKIRVDRNGSGISGPTSSGLTHAANQWYRARIQTMNTTIRAKIWLDGSSEPGSWTIDITDAVAVSPGHVALAVWLGPSTGNAPVTASFDELVSGDRMAATDSATANRNFIRTAADAFGLADVATRTVTLFRTVSDASSRSDVATRALTIFRTGTDALGLTDVATRTGSFFRTVADSVTRSDVATQSKLGSLSRTATDSLGLSDAATRTVVLNRTTSDSVTRSDVATRIGTFFRTATEVLFGTSLFDPAIFDPELFDYGSPDAASRTVVLFRSTSDSVTRADVATRTGTFFRTVTGAISFVDVATKSGASIARTATDALGLSDTASRVVVLFRTTADSITQSDVATRIKSTSRTATDSLGLSDVATRSVTLFRTVADSISQSDVVTRAKSTARTAADSLGLSDVATRTVTLFRTATDSITQSDVATRIKVTTRTTSDAITLSDSATRAVTLFRTVADSVTRADVATRTLTLFRTVTGSITLADVATRTKDAVRTVSDSISLSDAATRVVVLFRTTADSISRSDAAVAVKQGQVIRTVTDALGLSDAATRTVTLFRTTTDSITQSDVATRSKSAVRTVADSITYSDVATRSVTLFRTVADSITRSDAATRVVSFIRTATDSVTLSDVATQTRATVRSVVDAITLADVATRTVVLFRDVSDSLTLTEVSSRVVAALASRIGWVHQSAIAAVKRRGWPGMQSGLSSTDKDEGD